MNKIYKYVQENIINQIKESISSGKSLPWQKPWIGYGRPKNYVTQRPYTGINLLLLPSPGEYITFKQIKTLQIKNPSIKLKKGSKSTMVVFWKFFKEDDKETKDSGSNNIKSNFTKMNTKSPIFRYWNVFHISCVEGLEPHDDVIQNNNIDTVKEAEDLITMYSKEVRIKKMFGSDRAYYNASLDFISVPNIKQFQTENKFYSTVFHEIIHSTGHKSRLNRFKNADQFQFASDSYSKEELIAEIGSCMIMFKLGIADENINQNSISYLNGWLKAIYCDITLITFAAQQAEKAFNYVISIKNNYKNYKEAF